MERAKDGAAMRGGNGLRSWLAVVVGRAAGEHKRRWRRAGVGWGVRVGRRALARGPALGARRCLGWVGSGRTERPMVCDSGGL
jgi:hypothetical protein